MIPERAEPGSLRPTHSLGSAVKDLELARLRVLYPGNQAYPRAPAVSTLPLTLGYPQAFTVLPPKFAFLNLFYGNSGMLHIQTGT